MRATVELVAGRTAFDHDGSVRWNRTDLSDGLTTVANLDTDPQAEIILFGGNNDFVVLEHDGTTKLGPIHVPSGVLSRMASEIGTTIGRSDVLMASGKSWKSVGIPTTLMAATARRGS